MPINADDRDGRKKIFLDKKTITASKSISQDVVQRISSIISETIVNNYKDQYQFIDDSVIEELLRKLEKQQLLGCNTDFCMKLIEDNLDSDFKIISKLEKKSSGYNLTLKRIDLKSKGEVVSQRTIQFSENMLEYYTKEITRAIVEEDYEIKNPYDPSNLWFSNYFWKSAILPGSGQISMDRWDSRGRIFQYSAYTVISFTALEFLLVQKNSDEYRSINPLPVYALIVSGNPDFAYLYSVSQFSASREKYLDSINMFNSGILLYSLLWGANMVDLIYFSQFEKNNQSLKNKLELKQKRMSYTNGGSNFEVDIFTSLQYTIEF